MALFSFPFSKNKKLSLVRISFLQALGLALYCALVGVFFWKGECLFGPAQNFLAPAVVLIIFVTSALVCALIVLGYPIILFWEKKQTTEALKLVAYTTVWLALFFLLALAALLITS